MIEQKRVLATSIPGPRSGELAARKTAAVSAGVSTGLPAYIVRGEGGVHDIVEYEVCALVEGDIATRYVLSLSPTSFPIFYDFQRLGK